MGTSVVWPGSRRLIESYARARPKGWFDAEGYGPAPDGPSAAGARGAGAGNTPGGDIVLAHYQLAHTSGPNLSPNIRYAVHHRLTHRDVRYDWSQLRDLWRCHPALEALTRPGGDAA